MMYLVFDKLSVCDPYHQTRNYEQNIKSMYERNINNDM